MHPIDAIAAKDMSFAIRLHKERKRNLEHAVNLFLSNPTGYTHIVRRLASEYEQSFKALELACIKRGCDRTIPKSRLP